jgi:uncharacterized protein (UPF0276 family)
MPSLADLPALGVGLGFREPFRTDLFLHRERVDFLEVTADHYFDAPPEKLRELDLLAAHFPLIPHGLNLSLGSAEGLDPAYLAKFAALAGRVRSPYWSEHLAFTRAAGVEIGHLTPLPFTREAVETVRRNVAEARGWIGGPVILENITYNVRLPGAEMDEAEFLTAVLEEADCGLLLDVTNLWINGQTHGFDPVAFLDRIPLERVVQLHFVGCCRQGDRWIDGHGHPTPEPIWELLDEVLRRAPVKGIILERDEHFPPFAELLAELARARDRGRKHGRWA